MATFAASFHWMDRPKVAAAVHAMLEPDGAAVQIDTRAYRSPVEDTIDELRVRYLGSDKRAGKSIRNTSPSGEDEVFRAAGFLPMEVVTVPDGRVLERTTDDLVAQSLSSSSTAPPLFGDRLDEFVADARRALDEANPSGTFTVTLARQRAADLADALAGLQQLVAGGAGEPLLVLSGCPSTGGDQEVPHVRMDESPQDVGRLRDVETAPQRLAPVQ